MDDKLAPDNVGIVAREGDPEGTITLQAIVGLNIAEKEIADENIVVEPLGLLLVVRGEQCELLVADDPEYIYNGTDGMFLKIYGDIVTEHIERIEADPVCTIIDISVVKGV